MVGWPELPSVRAWCEPGEGASPAEQPGGTKEEWSMLSSTKPKKNICR